MPSVKLELQSFTVPNYALAKMPPGTRQEGMKEPPKWELRQLDAETLAALCDEFRREVFRKADKIDPDLTVEEPR